MLAIRGAFSRFFAESGLFLAAGLAFFFLVCCIPLSLLGVSTVGFVLSGEQAKQEVIGQLTRNFPVYRREIASVLLRIIDTRAVSGLTGTLILVFFSIYLRNDGFTSSQNLLNIVKQTTPITVMAVGLVLFAHPLDELRAIRTSVQPPQTVLVPPAPVDEETMPSLAVAHGPRRLSPTSISRPLAAPYLGVTVPQTPTEPVRARFPSGMTIASLPHAGLTQQTP